MRHVTNRLDYSLESPASQLIQKQGENNGSGKLKDHLVEVDHEGIADDLPRGGSREELREVLQSYPIAAENASPEGVILKTDYHAVHRQVVENDVIQKTRE
jgi:hypothetical protein